MAKRPTTPKASAALDDAVSELNTAKPRTRLGAGVQPTEGDLQNTTPPQPPTVGPFVEAALAEAELVSLSNLQAGLDAVEARAVRLAATADATIANLQGAISTRDADVTAGYTTIARLERDLSAARVQEANDRARLEQSHKGFAAARKIVAAYVKSWGYQLFGGLKSYVTDFNAAQETFERLSEQGGRAASGRRTTASRV